MLQLSLTDLLLLFFLVTLSIFLILVFLFAGCFGNTALFVLKFRNNAQHYSKGNTFIFGMKGSAFFWLSLLILYLGITQNLPYPLAIFFIPILFCIAGLIIGLKIDPKTIDFKTPQDIWMSDGIRTSFPTETNSKITSLEGITNSLNHVNIKYFLGSLILGLIITTFILLTN